MSISFNMLRNMKNINLSKIEVFLGDDPESLLSFISYENDATEWYGEINEKHNYLKKYINSFSNDLKNNLELMLIKEHI